MEKSPNQADEELGDKYDIVFIGGGPATLSFFSFICRNKNFENFFANLNTLIIEKSETFGSGCLGKYGINSNTSAEGFVRLICFNDDENGKEEKQNLSPNKKKPSGENSKSNFFSAAAAPNSNNNATSSNNNNTTSNFSSSAIFQKFKNKCVPIFEDLLHSNETKNLLSIGSKIAPLSMIGSFLDCVGNSITSYIHSKFHKRIFMNYCEVMKINVDYDKCFESNNLQISEIKNSSVYPFEIFVERNLSRLNNTSNNRNFGNSNGNNSNNKESSSIIKHFRVKSKLVVLGSGAQQKFDNKQKQDIIKLISPSDFFHSDYVLQEKGFNHLINNLKLKEKRRVVILGGSHSGFSCAWMLLNGYIDIYRLKEQNKSIRAQSAFENPNNNNNINNNNNNYNNQNGFYYKCKTNQNCLECKTLNCCFGSVIDRSWVKNNVSQSIAQSALENLEILILYRDHIKVYYSSEREALNDGYNVYDQSKAVNKNGNVYPFIGIRGDAKELYRRIVTGKEKRVKLQKANTFNEQKNFIAKASVVIWACGYTTQKMTFFDANCKSKEIEFYLDASNQFDVDKELHLLNKKKAPFFNLFGIGQGYSTHSIEVLGNGKFARADSVNLYNTYISKKLFKALDAIFNFTGENSGNVNNNEKEKENMKKTVNASKGHNNNNNHSSNNNCNNNVSKNSNWNNNNEKTPFKKTAGGEIKGGSQAELKQMQNNYNSNTGNKNTTNAQAHNQSDANGGCNNYNRINKENEPSSSKKIIQLIPSDSSSIRNSISNSNNKNNNNNIVNNHNSKAKNKSVTMNNNDNNLGASSTLLKKTNGNGQNFFNTPNIKTVKMISNNLASVSLHSSSILNGTSEAKKANLTKNSVLTNSSVFHGNLSSSTNNNCILRASYSRGLDKLASSSKTNFFKNNNNNEFNLEYNHPNNNHRYSNANNNNNNNNNAEFSPPSRNINSRSPVNIHAIETGGAVKRNFPAKRESSRLKSLQPIANMNMNFNNNNSNSNQNVLGNTKANAINKNFSNVNNLVNNNNYNYNNNNNLNVNNFGNHSNVNNQNNLTPNLYTNKNVLVVSRDRDFASKSPKTSSGTVNLISTSNNDVFKSSYKDLKEKNSVVNSTYLRKGNLQDFPRNQVYFGKTQINPNLKSTNINSAVQNNNPSEKLNEFGNRNNNNVNMVNFNNNGSNNNLNANHNKFPSYNLANMDKTGNRYEISPIPNATRSKSKYILYDSTKSIIPNVNGGVNSFNNNVNSVNQNYNFNYSLHSNNMANVLGKI